MSRFFSILITLAALLTGSFGPARAQAQGDLLIRNATVLTVTQGTHENADILIRNGRIEQIGSGLSAPRGIEIIDASGRYVMPGIIDAHSHIAISNVNEATNPVTAEVTVRRVRGRYSRRTD